MAKFAKRVGREIHLPLPARIRGVSGLTLGGTRGLVDACLNQKGKGHLILHVGANDIGLLSSYSWLRELEAVVFYIRARFPGYKIYWSDMLPRRVWRHGNKRQEEKKRRRLQRRARRLFLSEGGGVIRHPLLTRDDDLISDDGVHLGLIGQEILIRDFSMFF